MKHDILSQRLYESGLDILASNPPYIPEGEKKEMSSNVTAYEPGEALFVADDDPLIFYRKISEEGRRCLKNGGRLFFEIHEAYGAKVKSLLKQLGYEEVIIHKDLQEKDRMVSAINSASR